MVGMPVVKPKMFGLRCMSLHCAKAVAVSLMVALGCTAVEREDAAVSSMHRWPASWNLNAIFDSLRSQLPIRTGHLPARTDRLRADHVERRRVLMWYSIRDSVDRSYDGIVVWLRYRDVRDTNLWNAPHARYFIIVTLARSSGGWHIVFPSRFMTRGLHSTRPLAFDSALASLPRFLQTESDGVDLPQMSDSSNAHVVSAGIDSDSWALSTGKIPVVYHFEVNEFLDRVRNIHLTSPPQLPPPP